LAREKRRKADALIVEAVTLELAAYRLAISRFRATLKIQIGGTDMATARIMVGGTGAVAVFVETENGNPYTPDDAVEFVSASPSNATVDQNGNIAAVAANADGSDVDVEIQATDPDTGATASAVVTIGAAVQTNTFAATLTINPNPPAGAAAAAKVGGKKADGSDVLRIPKVS
jgi:hypothetical protein